MRLSNLCWTRVRKGWTWRERSRLSGWMEVDSKGLTDLNYVMFSLEINQQPLGRFPACRWRPQTLRLPATALLLPLVLLLARAILQLAMNVNV